MNEHRLYQKIIALFPDGDCQRIENSVGNGVPDINICALGMEVWVEAKMVIPAGVVMRKEQYAWGLRRAAAGGTVVVVASQVPEFLCWRFPNVKVKAWHQDAKYVVITNPPELATENLRCVRKFLFPCLT